jgi:hypothetical protein
MRDPADGVRARWSIRNERALRAWLAWHWRRAGAATNGTPCPADVTPTRHSEIWPQNTTRLSLLGSGRLLSTDTRYPRTPHYADMSVDEVATTLGKSPNTIKARLRPGSTGPRPLRRPWRSRHPRPTMHDGPVETAFGRSSAPGRRSSADDHARQLERRLALRRRERMGRRTGLIAAGCWLSPRIDAGRDEPVDQAGVGTSRSRQPSSQRGADHRPSSGRARQACRARPSSRTRPISRPPDPRATPGDSIGYSGALAHTAWVSGRMARKAPGRRPSPPRSLPSRPGRRPSGWWPSPATRTPA